MLVLDNEDGKRFLLLQSIDDVLLYNECLDKKDKTYFKNHISGTNDDVSTYGVSIQSLYDAYLNMGDASGLEKALSSYQINLLKNIKEYGQILINWMGGYHPIFQNNFDVTKYKIVEIVNNVSDLTIGTNNILILENDSTLPEFYDDLFQEGEHLELLEASRIVNLRECVKNDTLISYLKDVMKAHKNIKVFVYTSGLDTEQFNIIKQLAHLGINKYDIVICGGSVYHLQKLAREYEIKYGVNINVESARDY